MTRTLDGARYRLRGLRIAEGRARGRLDRAEESTVDTLHRLLSAVWPEEFGDDDLVGAMDAALAAVDEERRLDAVWERRIQETDEAAEELRALEREKLHR